MKFEYWVIGKTKEKHFLNAEAEYLKRIKKYTKLSYRVFPEAKGSKDDVSVVKLKEANTILSHLNSSDHLVLLDEKGEHYTSIFFSKKIERLQFSTSKRTIFLTGGAYGFHDMIYKRSQEMLALSTMTFSHQMIRTFFLEQFYRAFTIINNEKYHNH